MKIDADLWAIVKADGHVAGDGESSCLHHSREAAQANLDAPAFGAYLREMNGSDLRIVKVRLVEIVEDAAPSRPEKGATR